MLEQNLFLHLENCNFCIHTLKLLINCFFFINFFYFFFIRPIAGHANFCPNSISTKPQELAILLSTVKHEILHALGFSISLFAFYRDSEGNPLTPREDNGKPLQNTK